MATYEQVYEELIGGPAPEAKQTAMVGGAYDGASRFDQALALWAPPIQSADDDVLPDKAMMDARVRDTLRNDAYVRGGANIHQDNIVGSMFVLNAKPASKLLGKGFDEAWEEEFQEEVESRFTLWAESPDNWVDASRKTTFTGMVRLAVGLNVACGEILASVEWMRDFGRPFSTAIQFIDLDRLSNPLDAMDDTSLRGGVKRDRNGAALGYWIRMAHPTDYRNPNYLNWKYIEARKPWGRVQMIHILEQTRPDQTRGVSEMVSALKELRITKKFRDVVLQNAVVNATYAASIESDLPTEAVFAQLGGGDTSAGDAVASYAAAYLTQIAQYAGNARNLHIDGVKIPHLFPGTKLQLRPAGQGGPLGTEFEQSLLRYISASLGVSYEQLSRDYTNTNYSSARAAMAETWKFMGAKKRMIADRFASTVYRLWLEEAVNRGIITSLPRIARRPGWLYEAQRLDAISQCDWIGASRGQIDELKETNAAILRLQHNLTTHEFECSRLGLDWRQVKRQRAREIAMDEALGLPVAVMAGQKDNPDQEGDNAA